MVALTPWCKNEGEWERVIARERVIERNNKQRGRENAICRNCSVHTIIAVVCERRGKQWPESECAFGSSASTQFKPPQTGPFSGLCGEHNTRQWVDNYECLVMGSIL